MEKSTDMKFVFSSTWNTQYETPNARKRVWNEFSRYNKQENRENQIAQKDTRYAAM